MSSIYQQIHIYLKNLTIEFTEYTHPPVHTCEEAEQYYQDVPGGQSKNLFLRNKKGSQHYLIIIESHKTVDLEKLRELLNETKMGFASPERLHKYLQTTPGSVSPFGLIFDTEKHLKVIVDEDLFAHEQVHYHPNDNTKTILITTSDFKKFLESTGHEINYKKL